LLVETEVPRALSIEHLLHAHLTKSALGIRDASLAEARGVLGGGTTGVREAAANEILAGALAARGIVRSSALHADARFVASACITAGSRIRF